MNLHAYFQSLLPKSTQVIAVVQSESSDGTTACLTLANQPMRVQGTNGRAAGAKVFVETDPVSGARIVGDAPDLVSYDVEIRCFANHALFFRKLNASQHGCPAPGLCCQFMAHKLTTKAGRGVYARRKRTVEPLCGIIESARGFRRFFLGGLAQATREWRVACRAWNLKRMAKLRQNCVYFG